MASPRMMGANVMPYDISSPLFIARPTDTGDALNIPHAGTTSTSTPTPLEGDHSTLTWAGRPSRLTRRSWARSGEKSPVMRLAMTSALLGPAIPCAIGFVLVWQRGSTPPLPNARPASLETAPRRYGSTPCHSTPCSTPCSTPLSRGGPRIRKVRLNGPLSRWVVLGVSVSSCRSLILPSMFKIKSHESLLPSLLLLSPAW